MSRRAYLEYMRRPSVQVVVIAVVFLAIICVAAYSVFDNIPLFQDIHEEMTIVSMTVKGKVMYYEVDSLYPPLSYKLASGLHQLTKMDVDDTVQWFTIFVILLTCLAFSAVVITWHSHNSKAYLVLGSIVTLFSFTHPYLLLSWKMGNMLSALLALCFLIVLSNPFKIGQRTVLFLGVLLSSLCILTKQSFGLVLISTLLVFAAMKVDKQAESIWHWRVIFRKGLSACVLFGLFLVLTALFWSVLVAPDFTDGVALKTLLPFHRLGPGGHRDFYDYGFIKLPLTLAAWVNTYRPGHLLGHMVAVSQGFGYLLDYLAKVALLVASGVILRKEWSQFVQTRRLSDRAILCLSLLYFNVANTYFIDHSFQGITDLILTVASLAILFGIDAFHFSAKYWQIVVIPLVVAILGMGAFRLAWIPYAAYDKYCCTELVHFNDHLNWYLKHDQAVRLTAMKRDFEQAIPDIQNQKIWVIDVYSGFLYYFLDIVSKLCAWLTVRE